MVEQPKSPERPIEDEDGIPIVEDASLDEQVDDAPEEAESDDDLQDLEEGTSLDAVDTAALATIGSAGQMHFGPDR
jgi:hypothetical protein